MLYFLVYHETMFNHLGLSCTHVFQYNQSSYIHIPAPVLSHTCSRDSLQPTGGSLHPWRKPAAAHFSLRNVYARLSRRFWQSEIFNYCLVVSYRDDSAAVVRLSNRGECFEKNASGSGCTGVGINSYNSTSLKRELLIEFGKEVHLIKHFAEEADAERLDNWRNLSGAHALPLSSHLHMFCTSYSLAAADHS